MSVLSSERVADAEAAETRGRMQQLARPVVLVKAAVPMAKTSSLEIRAWSSRGNTASKACAWPTTFALTTTWWGCTCRTTTGTTTPAVPLVPTDEE